MEHSTDTQWWAEVDGKTETPWESLVEGQLQVDVFDRPDAIVVRSLVAGVRPEDLEISLNTDMLTLRGAREEAETVTDDQFYHRECYWGPFSRTIIIPVPVYKEKIKAFFKNGMVMIVLPKIMQDSQIIIKTEDDFLQELE